jgi:hypothetical protein
MNRLFNIMLLPGFWAYWFWARCLKSKKLRDLARKAITVIIAVPAFLPERPEDVSTSRPRMNEA